MTTAKKNRRIVGSILGLVVLLVVLAAASDIAYRAGRSSAVLVTVRHGIASTDIAHQTEITVGQNAYRVPQGVAWINSQGFFHNGVGGPPCFRPGRNARITFATVDVRSLGTIVPVWVKCPA